MNAATSKKRAAVQDYFRCYFRSIMLQSSQTRQNHKRRSIFSSSNYMACLKWTSVHYDRPLWYLLPLGTWLSFLSFFFPLRASSFFTLGNLWDSTIDYLMLFVSIFCLRDDIIQQWSQRLIAQSKLRFEFITQSSCKVRGKITGVIY